MFIGRFIKRRDANTVYLSMSAASSLFFALIFTTTLIYQVTVVGLNPLQLVLVGTVLEVTAFIFQVPTGILADLYSRRLAVIIGTILVGIGFMVEGTIARFEAVLLAQVVWGIGITFVSGAQEAWISDEVGAERVGSLFMRGSQIGSVGGLIGIGLAVLIGSVRINLPIVVGSGLYILMGMVLIFVMPETGFKPTPTEDRNSWQQMAHTIRQGIALVRLRPVLLTILLIELFFGLYSEGYDRLWTDHVLTNFTFPLAGTLPPVTWFGLMGAVAMLLSIGVTEVISRRVDTNNSRATVCVLSAVTIVEVISMIGFGLAGNFGLAVIAFWLFNVARSAGSPVFTAWINQHMDSSVRATMHSVVGQANAFGQIVGGPFVGGLTNGLTGIIGLGAALRVAMLIVGVILAAPLVLYARITRRDDPAIAETEGAAIV